MMKNAICIRLKHFQLIPRYEGNVIGSKLFVNERGIVVIDKEIIEKLRNSRTR